MSSYVNEKDLGQGCRRHQRAVWQPSPEAGNDPKQQAKGAFAVLENSGLKLKKYKVSTAHK